MVSFARKEDISQLGKIAYCVVRDMSVNPNLPWIVKYRPKNLSEYVNQEEAKSFLSSWIKDWLKGTVPSKRAVLLYGPPGVGKTALAEAIGGEFRLDVVEMNASDFRKKSDIERIALIASKARSFDGKPKIVLIDEVDGLSAKEDLGGVEAIVEVIKDTKNPIIMTANNAYADRLRSIRTLAEVILIELRELHQRDVIEVLKRICESEKLTCEEKALKTIHERNRGDLRSCINDLEAIGRAYGKVTLDITEKLTPYRDRELNPFDTLRSIFFAKYLWQAKSSAMRSELDFDTLMQWINENIPIQLSEPESVYQAYEVLSRADVHRGRIVKSGSWDLLSYANDIATAGIAMVAKREKLRWVKYSFPSTIKALAQTKAPREKLYESAKKIAKQIHVSSKTVTNEYVPLLRIIYSFDKVKATLIMKTLGISPDEAVIIIGDESVRELMERRITELKGLLKKRREERKVTSIEESKDYKPVGPETKTPSALSTKRVLP